MQTRFRTSDSQLLSPVTDAAILATIIVSALYFGRSIFVPLALAVLLSFVLSPLVVWLRKLFMPRPLAVGTVVLITVVGMGLLGFAMARQIAELGKDLPRYESTLREKLKTLRTGLAQSSIVDRATSTLSNLSKELEPAATSAQRVASTSSTPATNDTSRPIPVEVHAPPERPLDTYQRIVSALFQPLTMTAIVLLLVIFILLQRDDIRDRVIRLAGSGDIEATTVALNDAAYRLSRLFLAQSIINAGYGVVIALGLWAIGVPSPIVWGIVAALMRFVPYVGAILAAVFPLLLAAAVDPGWSLFVSTLALYLIVEPAVGHFLEPWVQGQSTGLSPLAIVVAAILWTALWGPIGLLLATPLTMCLVVLGRHVEGLSFLDVILGDQPALTPPEIFYQRLLAGSAAEAAEQARDTIATSTIIEYFDTVAVPGLQLALADRHRGAIDLTRMVDIFEGTQILLEDVAEIEPANEDENESGDEDPNTKKGLGTKVIPIIGPDEMKSEWQSAGSGVLCLGVHSPIDSAASSMLALALTRHGICARAIGPMRLAEFSQIDLSQIKLVWLSSIEASRSHASAKFMTRRLHRLAPTALICGFFRDKADIPKLDTLGLTAKAHSIEEAVRATINIISSDPPEHRTEKTAAIAK